MYVNLKISKSDTISDISKYFEYINGTQINEYLES